MIKDILESIIISFIGLTYRVFSWGFVIFNIWNWFIISLVNKPIEYVEAMGIILIISFLKLIDKPTMFELSNETKNEHIFTMIIAPWMCLYFAYLIKILIFNLFI